MTIYIIAQLIGFAGYLFYIGAPYLRTPSRIIQADALSCIIISVQWYLLEQPALLVLNLLSITVAIIALKAKTNVTVQKHSFMLYPIGCAALIFMSQDIIIGALVTSAFCLNVTSKFSQDIIAFRKYATTTGVLLSIAGILTLSIPATLFNLLFACGHILKLWQGKKLETLHVDTKKAGQTIANQPLTQ